LAVCALPFTPFTPFVVFAAEAYRDASAGDVCAACTA
jgi:hypothetical protein